MKAINNKLKFFLLFITFIFLILSFKQLEGFRTPILLNNLVTSQGEPANLPPTRPPAVNMNLLYSGGSLTESTYNSMTTPANAPAPPPPYFPPPPPPPPPPPYQEYQGTGGGEVAPPPTTNTTSTLTYVAVTTVLVGTIGGGIYLLSTIH